MSPADTAVGTPPGQNSAPQDSPTAEKQDTGSINLHPSGNHCISSMQLCPPPQPGRKGPPPAQKDWGASVALCSYPAESRSHMEHIGFTEIQEMPGKEKDTVCTTVKLLAS